MRFSFAALVLLVTPLMAVALPPQVEQAAEQLRLGIFGDDKDDRCPDLMVRCYKDAKLTKLVGDLGDRPYCWDDDKSKCKQCHQTLNNAECNSKYLKDCATKCEAIGTPL